MLRVSVLPFAMIASLGLFVIATCKRELPAPAASQSPAASAATPVSPPPEPEPAPPAPPPSSNVAPEPTPEEKKRYEEMARQAKEKTEAYDRSKLAFYEGLLVFGKETRAHYDKAFAAAEGLTDKAKAKKAIDAAQRAVDAKIAAREKKNDALDGELCEACMSFHVGLYDLRREYPAAMQQAIDGQRQRLDEMRASFDQEASRLRAYFDRLAGAPSGARSTGETP